MTNTPWTLRPATRADALALAALMNDLNRHEGLEPFYSEALVLRDGFGEAPAYRALIAEAEGAAVGYATYHGAYDSERGGRSLWLTDLYVAPEAQGRGVGQGLMAAVAKIALEGGCVSVWWGVRAGNTRARAFYAELGAIDDDARILELAGDALQRLAGSPTAHL